MNILKSSILISLFAYTSCNTSNEQAEEKQLNVKTNLKNPNKSAFTNTEGFLPSFNYKIDYSARGCFHFETKTIQLVKEVDGSIVALYYELCESTNEKKDFKRKTVNGQILNDIDVLITLCKEAEIKADKEIEKEQMIFSFTTNEAITISDGLHIKTYSFGDKLKLNPFLALEYKLFSTAF